MINNRSIRQTFADTLLELASKNPNLFVVDADLHPSLKLERFAQKFPRRFIQAGVAEANATGVAAGLSKAGKNVFLISYACFSPAINWAVIRQSVCYNQANIKIIGSHAGLLSGDLGASHQMLEDIALTRSLPGLEVFAPADAWETEKIVAALAFSPKPAYLRLVRPDTPIFTSLTTPFTIGKSTVIKKGRDLTIVGYGPILSLALQAQARLMLLNQPVSLEVINTASLKPFDFATIKRSLIKTRRLLVLEDHQSQGGLGELLAYYLQLSQLQVKFSHLAVKDRFGQSDPNPWHLYDHYGLGLDSILKTIRQLTTNT
jgi:transketolase